MIKQKNTIVALATPPGRGSVGIIRLSGKDAYQIGCQITQTNLKNRYAHYLSFYNQQSDAIDQGIAIYYKAPHSFTGEDIIELQGHGGPVVMDLLIKEALKYGAVIAKPGEFSERAFLNDKIDLAQAEAILDLIEASSEEAAKSAVRSLQGVFSQQINQLVDELIYLRTYVESAIDFPDEEIDFLSDGHIETKLKQIQTKVQSILDLSRQGVILKEGITVVIAGKPNAGKSSLLNALSGEDSAIVTDIAGTTRDILKEHIHINGLPLHIIDTAGLRESADIVEKEGIRRALKAMDEADLILYVNDINEVADPSTPKPITDLSDLYEIPTHIPALYLYNKVDLLNEVPYDQDDCIYISAKTGHGIEKLKEHLLNLIGFKKTNESLMTARRRHIDAIEVAQQHLELGFEQLTVFQSGELLAEELKIAQDSLSSITGAYSADDLLGEIFSSFCIGK